MVLYSARQSVCGRTNITSMMTKIFAHLLQQPVYKLYVYHCLFSTWLACYQLIGKLQEWTLGNTSNLHKTRHTRPSIVTQLSCLPCLQTLHSPLAFWMLPFSSNSTAKPANVLQDWPDDNDHMFLKWLAIALILFSDCAGHACQWSLCSAPC